jgi:shikimate kinase
MGKYILIGIPGTGKSTIGKLAARKLKMPFYNTDKMAYKKIDPKYQELLLTFVGARLFRQGLHSAMAELAELDKPAIIEACPEISLMPQCVKIMKKLGTIIYIKRDMQATLAEVRKNRNRMFMQTDDGLKIDMQAEAIRLYAKERHRYEALADMTLDNDGSCEDAVNKLVAMVRGHLRKAKQSY